MASLNSDERNLIMVQGFYFFGDSLAGIFVSVFIFAHSNFQTVLSYTAINFCMLLFLYILSGRIMEKVSSGAMVRTGLLLNAIFYLLLFVLRDTAVLYLVPLAILDGAAAGIFWAGLNLNQYVYSQQHTRVRYFGMQGVLNNGLRAAGPVIGGALITVLGKQTVIGFNTAYAVLFFITSLVYFCAALFISKLPQHELLTFSYRKFLTHNRAHAWKKVLWQHAVFGSFDVVLSTVIGILMFIVVKNEFLLGSAQTGMALVGVGGSLLAVKLLTHVKRAFWIGSLGYAIGIIIFALQHNLHGLIIFIIIIGLTGPFLSTWLLTEWFHTLDRLHVDWQKDFHILIERDIALGVPRIVSYIVFIYFVGQGDQVQLAWKALYILPIFPILLGLLFSFEKSGDSEILLEPYVEP